LNERLILTVLLLAFALQGGAQFFSQYKFCDRGQLEPVIEKSRKIASETALDSTLNLVIAQSRGKTKECIRIIKDVLLAELTAKKADSLNERSLSLYQTAIKKAVSEKNQQMEIWASINYAFYRYQYSSYDAALYYFIRVGQLAESFPPEEMIFPGDTFKKLGYFMGYIREYEQGIAYLKLAEKYTFGLSAEMAALKDNIGLLYSKTNDSNKARKYFDQALEIAVEVKDTLRQAKVLGNTADLYKKSGDYEKAIQLLHRDIYLSRNGDNNMNTMYALLRLSEVYLETGSINKARLAALQANSIAQSKVYFKSSQLEATELLLKIAQKTGNSDEELTLRRKIDSLNISLKTPEGTNTISKLNWEAQKQNFNEQLNKEKQRVKKGAWVRNGIVLLSALLLLITVWFLIKLKRKSKKNSSRYQSSLKFLQNEKLKSETRLREASNSLTAHVNYLSEKNHQIEKLESEIKNIKSVFNTDENRAELNKLLESHLMTEENWNRFKNAFALEYPKFYARLVNNYPELTEANWRIILLQHLRLSNGEIARLLGVTVEAVKKAKQRLKKKLNEAYESLMGVAAGEDMS